MTDQIETLEDIDAKITEQQERMKEEKQKEEKEEMSEEEFKAHLPFTYKMEQAFKEHIQKAQKCLACNWQNFGKTLTLMNFIEIMREHLPVPTFICGKCGVLFVPKWARRVMNQAIEQESKIIKQTTRVGAETGV